MNKLSGFKLILIMILLHSLILVASSVATAELITPEEADANTHPFMRKILEYFRSESIDSNVDNVDKRYHVRLASDLRTLFLDLSDYDGDKLLMFQPNTGIFTTVSVSDAKKFGLSYSKQSSSDENPEVYGKSTGSDLRFDYTTHQWLVSANYSNYQGFYTSDIPGQTSYVVPDLELNSFGVWAVRTVKPSQYSLRSVINQTARQIQRGGSVLLGISLRETKVTNGGGPIVDSTITGILGTQTQTATKIRSTSLIPFIGYGYQYNFTQNAFIGSEFTFGWGPTYLVVNDSGGRESEWESATNFNFKLFTGYNGVTHYFGLLVNSTKDSFTINDIGFSSGVSSTQFYYGFRFK